MVFYLKIIASILLYRNMLAPQTPVIFCINVLFNFANLNKLSSLHQFFQNCLYNLVYIYVQTLGSNWCLTNRAEKL